MEQNTESQTLFDLRIDETAKEYLQKIATWATVVVITAVIGYVLRIVEYVRLTSNEEYDYGRFNVSMRSQTNLGGIIFQILIGLLINYFLYQFAVNTKKGLNTPNQPDLNKGFKNLKIYFAFIGVLLIIGLFFLLLGILIVSSSSNYR